MMMTACKVILLIKKAIWLSPERLVFNNL